VIQILIDNPLLLLFIVVALSYPLGQLRIPPTRSGKGVRLGVAAVLFAGLAVGALDPNLKLPEIIYVLGGVLFVYPIGLSSGPGFFASFRRKGLRDNGLVFAMLVFAALLTAGAFRLLGLKATVAAGMFAGSLNNTPALAGVLEYIKVNAEAALRDQALAEPVIGYSIAYPLGVIGMIVAISVTQRLFKVNYAREAETVEEVAAATRHLFSRNVVVTRPEAMQTPIRELVHGRHWDIVFGRMKRDGQISLATDQTRLQVGDVLTVVGPLDDVDAVTAYLGAASDAQLELDRKQLDYRRIFVSNPKIAGHRLKDLNLPQQWGALITRVRRGDVEFVPHGDTVLELGDRVRVLTHRDHMDALTDFFGDSYRAISEVDILTFSLGLALGLLLGILPIPLPGGIIFRLGFAGGPLIVALILGTLRRTGPMVWTLPYSANLTLRQIGLILFLAGIGTRAGYTFISTFAQSGGLAIFLAGAAITTLTGFMTLVIGYRVLKIPMSLLVGILSGLQTQPAVLGFASEQTQNDLPNIGYATVYPVAIISKILFAQLLLVLLR
jgi:putative transport protein